jgi:hypothetical protein
LHHARKATSVMVKVNEFSIAELLTPIG